MFSARVAATYKDLAKFADLSLRGLPEAEAAWYNSFWPPPWLSKEPMNPVNPGAAVLDLHAALAFAS